MTKDEMLVLKSLIAVLKKKSGKADEAFHNLEPQQYDLHDYLEGLSDAYGIVSNLVSQVVEPLFTDESTEVNDDSLASSVE